MRFLSTAAVNAINWYQTDISPKKGFCCAYRIRHGGDSCSTVVKQAFLSRGFMFGIYSVFAQAGRCYSAAAALSEQKEEPVSQERENEDFCATWAATETAWCCLLPFIS